MVYQGMRVFKQEWNEGSPWPQAQGTAHFLPGFLIPPWPEGPSLRPSLLAPQVSSAPLFASAQIPHLPHLFLGLPQGLLLGTFVARHGASVFFKRIFKLNLLG